MEPDTLDQALERLHLTDLEYRGQVNDGLANHGPMAVDSLLELGGGEHVAAFLDHYQRRLRPLPPHDDRAPRLGDPKAGRAFLDHYQALLSGGSRDDARAAIARAIDELLPGAIAAAAHGWLRTAHAVRALLARDTPVRRREVAFGLATWASRFQALPGVPGARPTPGLDVTRALAAVPLLPVAARRDVGLIAERVEQIHEVPGFAAAVEALDLDARPLSESIGALARSAARLFLANPDERFVYLHAITATSALRLAAPALDDLSARRAFGAVFQAVAALHSTHGDPSAVFSPDALGRLPSVEDVRRVAVASDDDHDVKLAAAVLRELAVQPSRELLAVAAVRLRMS